MKIEFAESAICDLEDIKTYYDEQHVPDIGNNFILDIISHIEQLADNPKIGRQVPEFCMSSIRELIHPPFRIVYVLNEISIQIIRVWRSERLMHLPLDY
ncbi:type II toxin-antitoxin system RelE/ParE family toxin [Colwellia sp. MB02u-10]|uniref:type II toxin-antitoxin system RelE/ParE family toxin n=1 Tax=Colwellia sp. MB02u-10 TaxID=2759828 RepID=UPI0015F3BC1F|nr:type II toxin-antitoxin system RelE/ParE family toxin [Colwellia sp. MB02u-10]MBA6340164.1 type II toxin-antitoxin system RelE/ParE family toxin [Colwellia sp. MB02u-10]